MEIQQLTQQLSNRFPYQPTFLQAVTEWVTSIVPYLEQIGATNDDCRRIERLLAPERIITFKVTWLDDAGVLQLNTGYRVQFNSALGPYKGGLRFAPTVNEDVLKFLAFEQIFKNALTGLPLGAGKGGSDFDPHGKSDAETRAFCRAFMTELYRHIGPETDVPAGDIGVGAREIGYLYGMYKQIANRSEGVLSGKGVGYGGSHGRAEATGHGVVYFAKLMLGHRGDELARKSAVVSGSGNVAIHTAQKLIDLGATVLTLSDRGGYLVKSSGLTMDDVALIASHKRNREPLSTCSVSGAEYCSDKPWQNVKADMYFPCATENELSAEDADAIIAHGACLVAEGANMPSTLEAIERFRAAGILFGPGKAVNAGGVSVSALEMSQNAMRLPWTIEEVDERLQVIMRRIHDTCVQYGTKPDGAVDYVDGANVGGFVRVFAAMRELGW